MELPHTLQTGMSDDSLLNPIPQTFISKILYYNIRKKCHISQAFFSFISESEEGIEPSTQKEELPLGWESNPSHQTLL